MSSAERAKVEACVGNVDAVVAMIEDRVQRVQRGALTRAHRKALAEVQVGIRRLVEILRPLLTAAVADSLASIESSESEERDV